MSGMETMHVAMDLLIRAQPEQVFAALTTGIALWWGPPYLYGTGVRNIVLEPKVGGRLYESWHIEPDDKIGALHGTVVVIQPPSRLVMQGCFGMIDHAAQGTVSFKLSRQDGGTLLHFSHNAFGELTEQTRTRYADGWRDLLDRLKALLEKHAVQGVQHDPALEDNL